MKIFSRNLIAIKDGDLLYTEMPKYDSNSENIGTELYYCKVLFRNNELHFVDCNKNGEYNPVDLQKEMNLGSLNKKYEKTSKWKKWYDSGVYIIPFEIVEN